MKDSSSNNSPKPYRVTPPVLSAHIRLVIYETSDDESTIDMRRVCASKEIAEREFDEEKYDHYDYLLETILFLVLKKG